MSLLVKRHKRTGKWKFWTTISDAWTTDWLSTDQAKGWLAGRGYRDADTFPVGWYDYDTWELGNWNIPESPRTRPVPPPSDEQHLEQVTPPNILAGDLGVVTEYRVERQWDSRALLTLTVEMNQRGVEEFG